MTRTFTPQKPKNLKNVHGRKGRTTLKSRDTNCGNRDGGVTYERKHRGAHDHVWMEQYNTRTAEDDQAAGLDEYYGRNDLRTDDPVYQRLDSNVYRWQTPEDVREQIEECWSEYEREHKLYGTIYNIERILSSLRIACASDRYATVEDLFDNLWKAHAAYGTNDIERITDEFAHEAAFDLMMAD